MSAAGEQQPILMARGLVKRYGRVTALDHADFDLMPGEILGVIGDNGAGKSTLIKALCGAVFPDHGEVFLDGKPVHFRSPMEARSAGIETVYQNLALSPALSIADNMFLGRERRKPGFMGKYFRWLDRGRMQREAREHLSSLGLLTIQNINQTVETLPRPAPGRGCRSRRRSAAAGHHGRADRGPRRRANCARCWSRCSIEERGLPIILSATTCRTSSRSPTGSTSIARLPHRGDQAVGAFDVRCRRHHDRRHEAVGEAAA